MPLSPEESKSERYMLEVLSAINNSSSKEDAIKQFSTLTCSRFLIDIVRLKEVQEKSSNNALDGYVISTRKPYTDNQLSDYSEFPELILYKNNGYKSCSIVPVIIGGRVSIVIEMLSQFENKFGEDVIRSIIPAAYLIGFDLMYSTESSRSSKLAGYFDSSFNTLIPQFLVSSDNKIVKANKASSKAFPILRKKGAEIGEVIGINFDQLFLLTKGTAIKAVLESDGKKTIFAIAANRISDNLIEVSALDIEDTEIMSIIAKRICADSNIGIIFLDEEGKIAELTESFGKILAYPTELMIGKALSYFIDQDSKDNFIRLIKGSENKSASGSIEIMNGEGGKVRLHLTAAKSRQGHIIGFAEAEDEKDVESMRENLIDFVNGSSDTVLIVDKTGYIKDCNIMAQTVLGYPKEDLSGRDIKTIYYDAAILDRDMSYVAKGGKIDNSYVNLMRSGSQAIAATHSIRMVRSEEGESEYIFIIKELDTKRRLNDQESDIERLKKKIKDLESIGELKSQFIYNISHELKTPLTSIKGYGKLLHDGEFGELTEQQKSNTKVILEEAERLGFIIQQVLDAAKLESQLESQNKSNKFKLDLSEVNLQEIKNNSTIKSLENRALEKKLKFSFNVDYDLPIIFADPNKLLQVFINLISNAIKFTETGSITVHIFRKTRNKIECEVIDTGIGINDEEKKRIFKEFYQTKKGLVKQEGSGTGLGLSIAKYIVNLHGGKIAFESQQGNGTKFFFTLPISHKARKRKGNEE